MKPLSCLTGLTLTLTCYSSTSLAAVSSSDIAIIGYYTDGSPHPLTDPGDGFAWVALNEIAAGEVLYFSDSSYHASNKTTPFVQEGLVRFTAPTTIAAGTVLAFEENNAPAGYETLPGTAYSLSGAVTFSTPGANGDQLVVFQNDDVSDTDGFTGLWAVNLASTQWGSPFPESSLSTDLYPGLTDGVNALALGAGSGPADEYDNARYVGPTSGTAQELASAISDITNWQQTDDGQGKNFLAWVRNDVAAFDVIDVVEPCSADLNDDDVVNVFDLLDLLSAWGSPDADLTDDGNTNVFDLLQLLSVWGACA